MKAFVFKSQLNLEFDVNEVNQEIYDNLIKLLEWASINITITDLRNGFLEIGNKLSRISELGLNYKPLRDGF